MARKKKPRKQENSEVPISSMIDVVFLLLTFFIFTSKEVIEEAYVDLKPAGPPSQNQAPPPELDKVKLEVEVAPNYYKYANRQYEIEALDGKIGRLAAVDPSKVSVTIMTSLDSDHEKLIQFLDICKKHSIEDFNILSKK